MATKWLKGIDTYHGDADFDNKAAMKAGIGFSYLKIGQGGTVDSKFIERHRQAEIDGITHGGYFFYDTGHSPNDQASLCLATYKPEKHDLPVSLDIETNTGGLGSAKLAQDIHLWLELIEKGSGKKPIIYTSSGFWNSAIPNNSAIFLGKNYQLWIAHYTSAASPRLPTGWTNWVFWQWAAGEGAGGPQGITLSNGHSVDSNKFLGTHADLIKHFSLV